MRVTKHFPLSDFTKSETADKHGIANIPNEKEMQNLYKLALVLEEVRTLCGNNPIITSSGFRNEELNRLVGGSPTSAHRLGLACDFRVKGMRVRDTCIKIRDSNLMFDQLIYEFNGYSYWVHLGLSEKKPRRQVMTYDKKNKYRYGII